MSAREGGDGRGRDRAAPGREGGPPARRLSFGRLLKRVSLTALALVVIAAATVAALVGWYFTRREAAEPMLASGEVALPRGLRSVTLYFASPAADSLVAVERQIVDTDRVTEAARTLIEELVRGPGTADARATFPAGIGVRHVVFGESGSVYVDFSPDLPRRFRGGSTAEYLLLASLVRTLAANLPTASAVVVTAGGQPLSTLGGHFGLEAPLAVSQWR